MSNDIHLLRALIQAMLPNNYLLIFNTVDLRGNNSDSLTFQTIIIYPSKG